jgi:Ca2+-binding EF-hand superfamily protein
MKILISEIDRLNAKSVALKNIAEFFNIPNWRLKSNDELEREIRDRDADGKIIKPLENYFTAYDEWFKFYQERRAIEIEKGTEYELNDAEQSKLLKLIDKRNGTLSELQSEVGKLQL